jgi:hypothetical protein
MICGFCLKSLNEYYKAKLRRIRAAILGGGPANE